MDPLSDVLSILKIHNHWSERFQWGEEWCLEFGRGEGIRIYAVLAGECWLSMEGVRNQSRVGQEIVCCFPLAGRSVSAAISNSLP